MDSPTGHPVAAAVARETIAILHDNNIPGHVRTTSRTLLAGLDPLRGKDGVIDVRDVIYFVLSIAFWLYASAVVIDLKKAD